MDGKVAVVSHDAGGAEILSSWLGRRGGSFCLVLDGPARSIFKRKLDKGTSMVSLTDAINQSDWVLCGTSWQSDLERRAIEQAQSVGKKVVAFLDHWSNYEKRFQEFLPDEIWVGDKEARKLAELYFPETVVVLQPNPYFLDLQEELDAITPRWDKAPETCSILYICEPTGERALQKYGDARFLTGYTETDALRYFLNNINALGCSAPVITLRPHPSEKKDKYDWVQKEASIEIIAGGEASLLQEVTEADVVVGCASMALVVGLLAKKRVVSCIPPGGKAFSLPYTEIEHLQLLVEASRGVVDA